MQIIQSKRNKKKVTATNNLCVLYIFLEYKISKIRKNLTPWQEIVRIFFVTTYQTKNCKTFKYNYVEIMLCKLYEMVLHFIIYQCQQQELITFNELINKAKDRSDQIFPQIFSSKIASYTLFGCCSQRHLQQFISNSSQPIGDCLFHSVHLIFFRYFQYSSQIISTLFSIFGVGVCVYWVGGGNQCRILQLTLHNSAS